MKPIHTIYTCRINGDELEEVEDKVASETPLLLTVNGQELATLLCTPNELEEMAVGFLLSEGILAARENLLGVEIDRVKMAAFVTIQNLPDNFQEIMNRKSFTSGCGKGITFSDVRHLKGESLPGSSFTVEVETIQLLLKEFRSISELFRTTGGVHSAALTEGNRILMFSEDIGRHNAVDKLIGKAFLKGIELNNKVLLSSGRISGEIMTKVIRSNIPILVSRAAPTCMSVTAAEDHGVTLIGFARGKRMNIYTHPQRLVMKEPSTK